MLEVTDNGAVTHIAGEPIDANKRLGTEKASSLMSGFPLPPMSLTEKCAVGTKLPGP